MATKRKPLKVRSPHALERENAQLHQALDWALDAGVYPQSGFGGNFLRYGFGQQQSIFASHAYVPPKIAKTLEAAKTRAHTRRRRESEHHQTFMGRNLSYAFKFRGKQVRVCFVDGELANILSERPRGASAAAAIYSLDGKNLVEVWSEGSPLSPQKRALARTGWALLCKSLGLRETHACPV